MTAELRLSRWAQIMRERTESGLSVKAYCEKEGIHQNSYFYWQKKIREAVGGQMIDLRDNQSPRNLERTSFLEVKATKTISEMVSLENSNQNKNLQIEIGEARINADSVYPVDKLIKLLRGLMRA